MQKLQEDMLSIKAQKRACIYDLLSTVYGKEPSQEFLENFRKSDFSGILEGLGIKLGEHFKKKPLKELVDELAVEYTQLFLGPGTHIYPYESAYCNEKGILFSKTALKIKRLIESSGLRYDAAFYENFDHISVELEFMEKITNEEAKAWKKEDKKKILKLLEFQRSFVSEHLVKWVPQFCENVINQADLSFYREMAKLTREYVLLEECEIGDLVLSVEINK
ncbi:MAG: molecular chaperone TorD family protein [bacterium]